MSLDTKAELPGRGAPVIMASRGQGRSGVHAMRTSRIARFLGVLMMAAVPAAAIIWVLTRLSAVIITLLMVLVVGAVVYALTPARRRSGKGDRIDSADGLRLSGRAEMMALDLEARPLKYQRNRDDVP